MLGEAFKWEEGETVPLHYKVISNPPAPTIEISCYAADFGLLGHRPSLRLVNPTGNASNVGGPDYGVIGRFHGMC